MTVAATTAERRARLARRHHLHPAHRARTPSEAAAGMVALHATDPVSIYLGLLARVRDITVADIDRALYDDRALVRVLAMRRTIFVTRAEDVAVPFAACSRRVAAAERARLVKQLAASSDIADPATWLEATLAEAHAVLAELGPCPANVLTAAVPALQTRWNPAPGTAYGVDSPVGPRILSQLSMEGLAERDRPTGGSFTSTRFTWRVVDPPLRARAGELGDDEARRLLLGRWLERFGPATEADLVWWSGLTKTAVRAAMTATGAEALTIDDATPALRLPDDDLEAEDPGPWVAVLPGLDPTTMGWRDRDWYLDPAMVPELFDRNGNAGPTIWADGRVVGGWTQRADGTLVHQLLTGISDDHRDLLAVELERITAFLGDVRVTARFRTPLERRLAAG